MDKVEANHNWRTRIIVVRLLAAQAGANVKIIGRQLDKTQRIADLCNEEFGEEKIQITSGADSDKAEHIKTADVVFSTGAAGIELLSTEHISSASQLKVAADINAIPPSGISGLDPFDNGKTITGSTSGAVGLGALAIGNIKYKTQSRLLTQMIESNEPVYLHFEHAFEVAREIIKSIK
jgi:methylene-tetrahydromethanopterin dehydrogenase